jgi:hypothetical protein
VIAAEYATNFNLAIMAVAGIDALYCRKTLTAGALRAWGRDIAERMPDVAREMRIGRPDLPRAINDGGLVDVNSASAQLLGKTFSLEEPEVRSLVSLRTARGRFADLSDLQQSTGLRSKSVRRARDHLVFL